jgi:hypothetical protein
VWLWWLEKKIVISGLNIGLKLPFEPIIDQHSGQNVK